MMWCMSFCSTWSSWWSSSLRGWSPTSRQTWRLELDENGSWSKSTCIITRWRGSNSSWAPVSSRSRGPTWHLRLTSRKCSLSASPDASGFSSQGNFCLSVYFTLFFICKGFCLSVYFILFFYLQGLLSLKYKCHFFICTLTLHKEVL